MIRDSELLAEVLAQIESVRLASIDVGVAQGWLEAAIYLRTLAGQAFIDNNDGQAAALRVASDKLDARGRSKLAYIGEYTQPRLNVTVAEIRRRLAGGKPEPRTSPPNLATEGRGQKPESEV